MTTQSFSTRLRHDSDATFQEWAQEIFDRFVAVGLVNTADTGQLATPVVAARPADNTDAGYWIFRFNDSLQGSAPIFLKVIPGTLLGGSNAYPRLRIYVGTGTDGAGTLTGILSSTTSADNGNVTGFNSCITDTAYLSLLCHTEGFFGFAWKAGFTPDPKNGLFCISRTCDSSGTPTALGAIAVWGGSSTALRGVQAFRYAATAAAYRYNSTAADAALGMNPQAPSASSVGSDFQAYVAYTITPQVQPIIGLCGVYESEVPLGTTFSATLVGSTARTYVGLLVNQGLFGGSSTGSCKFAMLWE